MGMSRTGPVSAINDRPPGSPVMELRGIDEWRSMALHGIIAVAFDKRREI